MGINLAVILSICCCFRSSLPSTQEGDPTRLGRPASEHGAYKPNGADMEAKPQDVSRGTPSSSNVSSKEAPECQTTTLATTVPEVKDDNQTSNSGQAPRGSSGFLNNASNFILNQPVMINEAEDKVLRWLAKFTMTGAEFDASGHVPGCHPGTRIAILELLQRRIGDSERICRIVWLHGTAGVGKSAILQSLAEQLSETSRLGATLFFSRPNGRHDPNSVIPTIAYQLAVGIPAYKEYVRQIMVSNPKLLEKDVRRQFQALIIEPFTKLRMASQGGRWVILLDGLDECEGETAQILIVSLISHFTRQYPTAPLVWIIASRPEAHLRGVFNSEEVRGSFEEHEVLADSDDACSDVERYLRAKFGEIRQNYQDLIPTNAPWPAEQDITRISKTSSGLFALAATIVNYVEDWDACDPIFQLATVLSATEGLEPGSLSTLYTLYSTILAGVPKILSPILRLMLTFYTTLGRRSSRITDDNGIRADEYPLVLFATIFGLQQHVVYGALRKLHSVIKVPSVSESGRLGIKFYHASFSDYLKALKDYSIDVDMMRKFWWGWFGVVHGGDSTSENAISDGRPPVSLSWDVKLASVREALWRRGLMRLLHLLLPKCSRPVAHPNHIHLPSNMKELQNILERFDFSTLIFRREDWVWILGDLFDLYQYLVNAVSPELSQLDVFRKVILRDLDLACIPEAKLSYEARLRLDRNGWIMVSGDSVSRYAAIPPQNPNQEWRDKVLPTKGLISKLDKLQSGNPVLDVLVLGKGPSRRCALISTRPTDKGWLFYYVPYCG